MDLQFADRPYRVQPWSSTAELAAFLNRCDGGNVLLESAWGELEPYSITIPVLSGNGEVQRFGIGTGSGPNGGPPHLLLKPQNLRVVVGDGATVSGIDVLRREVEFQIRCEGQFQQFVEVGEARVILAFHEAGVLAVTEGGLELWRQQTARILDWACEQERLFVRIEGASTLKLDVRTGRPLEPAGTR